jgi:hypothetical protein
MTIIAIIADAHLMWMRVQVLLSWPVCTGSPHLEQALNVTISDAAGCCDKPALPHMTSTTLFPFWACVKPSCSSSDVWPEALGPCRYSTPLSGTPSPSLLPSFESSGAPEPAQKPAASCVKKSSMCIMNYSNIEQVRRILTSKVAIEIDFLRVKFHLAFFRKICSPSFCT